MQVHGIKVFYVKAIKAFPFMAMLCLLMVCNGCFTYVAESICYRCHDDIQIIERRGEVSNDGKRLSIYLKKRTDYCRDPFGIWKGSIEEEGTYEYPLTSPEPHAVLKQFPVVLDDNCTLRASMQPLEVKNGKEAETKEVNDADYNPLILPLLQQVEPVFEIHGQKNDTIRIHPDDLPFLSRPFVYKYWGYYSCYKLVIPYKQENGIYYMYLPKKGLISPSKMPKKPNIGTQILKTLLIPPAMLLDVLTFPVQAIYVVYRGADC